MEHKAGLKDPFQRISADQANELIEKGELKLIDVRDPQEWTLARIPGATLIPLMTLLTNPREHLKEDGVIFHCAEGIRSALACEVAAAIGLMRIYNLEGGIKGWSSKGYPVEK